jgi:uncharacterized membrane protein (DUF4010 family)
VLKLLLITVVVLPLLPDRGFGPWQSLNPYAIWWMVVLIASISFVGYLAVRLFGERRGTVFSALAGGLASSTAVTLQFARAARTGDAAVATLAGGILLACAMMFLRMLALTGVVAPGLLQPLLWPALLMSVIIAASALLLLRAVGAAADGGDRQAWQFDNPVALRPAMLFGGLLAAVMLLASALRAWFGDAGLWPLAMVSGLVDVDAITLSLATMVDLEGRRAASGILLAAASNSVVKAGMAAGIGGRALGWRVGVPMGVALLAGLGLASWQLWA